VPVTTPVPLSAPTGVGVTDAVGVRLRWAAFDRLRAGQPASVADLAGVLGLDPAEASAAVGELAAAGLIERDGDGSVIGAHGLSLAATRHRLVLDGVELHTWCALDAVGIPAALGVDADVSSPCGWCDRHLDVHAAAGIPTGDDRVVLWLPTSPCSNVRRDFCPLANLFCDIDHLDAWRRSVPNAEGEARSVERAAAVGRRSWARGAGCCDDAPKGWR